MHAPAVDLERRAVLLHDGEIAQSHVGASLVGAVGARSQWDGRGAFVFLHAHDLAGVEVNDGAQTLDRVRVDIGVGLGPQPHGGPHQSSGGVDSLGQVRSEGPGLDVHRVQVGDASPSERGQETLVAKYGIFCPLALQSENRSKLSGDLLHMEYAAADFDQRDAHKLLGTVPERGSCHPWQCIAWPPRANGLLGRLLELQHRQQARATEQ